MHGFFEIECPLCGKYTEGNFGTYSKQIYVDCCNTYISIPKEFTICDKCDGNKSSETLGKLWGHTTPCDKCEGNGVLTWVDKVLR